MSNNNFIQDIQNPQSPIGKYTSSLFSPNGIILAGCLLGIAAFSIFSGGKKGKLATSYFGGGKETAKAKKKALKQVTAPKCDSATLYIGRHKFKDGRTKGEKGSGGTPLYIPDVQRGTAVIGAPGSGKSFSAINPMIYSAIDQGFPIVLYDFKYPTQAKVASYAKKMGYEVHVFAPGFPESEVCNPLDFLRDATDAETARQLATVINKNFKMMASSNEDAFFGPAGDQLTEAILMLTKGMQYPDIMTAAAILSSDRMVERLMAANLNPWIKISFGQLFSSAGSEKTIAGIAGTASLMFTRFMKKNTLGCFVVNSRVERERIKQENIKIAQTAVEMLKVYGEETDYGYKVYRSDAFVIKQEGSKYSIHHRRDELNQFDNPLMQFSLNSKGNPKIEIPPNQMMPVERQEFLMVGERLESGKKLPQLANADLRDVANNLGSLAPAGTFKTLESFRETEMLGLLNSALQKANTDTLNVGEYTISRTRNLEAGRANLSLYKTAESGERKELLAFTLQKTEQGLTKQVDKLSISDWDLTQLKFISENAKAFDLGHTLGNFRGEQKSQESISEIRVPLHPSIQKAWSRLETLDSSKWHSSIRQENEGIRQNLQDFGGKLSIAEQRELYFQFLAQERLDSSTEKIKIPPLKEIMKDLLSWRHEAISNRYSPKEYIPMTQEKTASRNSTNSRSQAEISL